MSARASLTATGKRLQRGLKQDFPLSRLCTLRAGGPARFLAEPVNLVELAAVLKAAHAERLPILLLGGGSNILVSDGGFPGLAIRLAGGFRRTRINGRSIEAGAGVPLARVVRRALESGGGDRVESLFGIPGTMGGAVRMNAGAHGVELSRYLVKVEAWRVISDAELEMYPIEMARDEIRSRSGYRQGPLVEGDIVTKAIVEVKPYRGKAAVEDRLRDVLERRRECQPQEFPSAGSVFKNIGEHRAGRLIEEAGCKGWREGAAEVSRAHANFIINRGGATAADLYRLADRVRRRVADVRGVELELEWQLVGSFDSGDLRRGKP
ncbi:MAG: UDP-N-acetylmuramate dehydrogenase [Candidatus Geothermincolia bacterium]